MEKMIKEFKSLSGFIGFMAVLQLLNLVNAFHEIQAMDVSVLANMDVASMGIAESTMLNIVKVFAIVPMVLGILMLAILCFKGLKEAKDPSPAKFHLILAVICAIFFAFGAVEVLVSLFSNTADLWLKLLEIVLNAASAVLMIYYFQLGKQIRTKE